MAALREREAVAARALEFLVLTATRSGEVLGARWGEIDVQAKLWIIPAARMKGGREHRVPLSPRAIEILREIAELWQAKVDELRRTKADTAVFPGRSAAGTLSGMAFAMLLRRMKRGDLTAHGFRSTFRDWAGEATNFAREVAEAALAHTVGDDVERAYRRGDALEKRRKLMEAWASYCLGRRANVITLRASA
jgi:integrase